MTTREIRIDRARTLTEQSETGHNRWHPGIPPALGCDPGDGGDLLEVEILEVAPEPFGFTCQIPGFGFLADVFTEPYLVRWRIEKGFATSEDLPGVRVPGAPFMGTIGLSPGHELMRRTREREQAALDADGAVLPPDPAARAGRQRRHQAPGGRYPAVPARGYAGRAVLRRRRSLRPG